MHIPLPKPLHGWRAFVGEVGIIVLGVLIALAFGQLAQSVHDRIAAAQAREAIRAEVRENLWWLEIRENYEPCIDGMINQLGSVLARARSGEPTPLITDVDFPVHSKMTSLRWNANAQAGRASLFSEQELRTLGNMYFTTDEYRDSQEQEEALWARIGFVVGLRLFTPADTHDLGVLLSEARYRDSRARLDVQRARQWAARLHLTAANPDSVEKIRLSSVPDCPSMMGPPTSE
jgi:hypothetical protein